MSPRRALNQPWWRSISRGGGRPWAGSGAGGSRWAWPLWWAWPCITGVACGGPWAWVAGTSCSWRTQSLAGFSPRVTLTALAAPTPAKRSQGESGWAGHLPATAAWVRVGPPRVLAVPTLPTPGGHRAGAHAGWRSRCTPSTWQHGQRIRWGSRRWVPRGCLLVPSSGRLCLPTGCGLPCPPHLCCSSVPSSPVPCSGHPGPRAAGVPGHRVQPPWEVGMSVV